MIIKAIHLTNFKGIEKKVSIPLAPLTLLFGGNSSGKSTVLQAFLYLYELLINQNADPVRVLSQGDSCFLNGFENLVNKKDLSKSIRIDVDLDASDLILDNFLSDTEEVMLSEFSNEKDINFELNEPTVEEVRVSIEVAHDEIVGAYVSFFSISLNNDLFAEIKRDGSSKQIWLTLKPTTVGKLGDIYQDEAIPNILSEGVGSNSFIQLDQMLSPIPDPNRRIVLGKNSWTAIQGLGANYFVSKVLLESILSQLIAGPIKVLQNELQNLTHIGPVRITPPRGYAPNKIPSDWYSGLGGWDRFANLDDEVKSKVNAYFSKSGFKTKYEFLTKGEYKNIHVMDLTNKIMHEPAELGIGISQIFPVIVACSDANEKFISVEEPELHLHPAWQLILADIFIQSIMEAKNKFFLIETHSEHLVLRLLYRVRHRNSKSISQKLRLEPDDLSIICIGSKRGKPTYERKNVTDDGDFSDAWPDGFFDERDGELF